jgi:hypothetical protein
MVRSSLALQCQQWQSALHTLIRQSHQAPSCEGHSPNAERTVGPARIVTESLTRDPELENPGSRTELEVPVVDRLLIPLKADLTLRSRRWPRCATLGGGTNYSRSRTPCQVWSSVAQVLDRGFEHLVTSGSDEHPFAIIEPCGPGPGCSRPWLPNLATPIARRATPAGDRFASACVAAWAAVDHPTHPPSLAGAESCVLVRAAGTPASGTGLRTLARDICGSAGSSSRKVLGTPGRSPDTGTMHADRQTWP